MPIRLTCTNCKKPLQVADQYAGRRVSCPSCKTVLTAPGAAPTAPAPPAPPPAATRPVATATPASIPAAKGKPFSIDEDNDPSPPTRKPTRSDTPGGKEPPWKGKRKFDDEDGERPSRKRQANRAPAPVWERPAAKAWSGFGTGCGLVRWGLWIELLAVAYMICLFGYLVTSFVDKPGVKPEILKSMGLFVIVPFFYLTLIGTGFIALGRTRMLSLPPGTGAGGVLTGAFVLSGLRALAVLASAALVTQAAMAWPDTSFDKMGRYLVLGVGSWLISIVPGVIAELTVVPGLAIAGGSIPSLRLRRRTGRFAFVLQVVALAFVFLGVLGYFGLASILSGNVSVRDIV